VGLVSALIACSHAILPGAELMPDEQGTRSILLIVSLITGQHKR